MPEDAPQPASPLPPRRRYTVTAKVLAANRRNLEKANAVPKEIRYRPTPKRQAACRRNLSKTRSARPSVRQPGSCASLHRAFHRSRQKLTEFEKYLWQISRILAPKGAMQVSVARSIGEAVWGWLTLIRSQCEQERRVLKGAWQWAWPVSDTSQAARQALEVLRVFGQRPPLMERCETYAARLKKLGEARASATRGGPSATAADELQRLLAAGMGKPSHSRSQAAPEDAPPAPAATQEPSTGVPSTAASSTESSPAGAPIEGGAKVEGKPAAWPEFDEYQKWVEGALGARPALDPWVHNIARLSWERHRLIEDWTAQAQRRLQALLQQTPSPCPVGELTAKLETALGGEAMERLGAEGMRLEAELRTALSQYLWQCYGPHSIFTLVGPPPFMSSSRPAGSTATRGCVPPVSVGQRAFEGEVMSEQPLAAASRRSASALQESGAAPQAASSQDATTSSRPGSPPIPTGSFGSSRKPAV